jgi:hypothetical protein
VTTSIELGDGLSGLRERMAKDGLDALLLASEPARRHALVCADVDPADAVGDPLLLVSTSGALTLVDPADAGVEVARAMERLGPSGLLGTDPDLPGRLQSELAERLRERPRPAGDLLFAELACSSPEQRAGLLAAASLADVGYTAVMDHLYVGQPVQEIADNVTRSTRRAGGGSGWAPPRRAADPAAGSGLVTVRGFDADERLTATVPVRYVLHPLLDGHAGFAAATALLSEPDPTLRALGELAASAFRTAVAALRPGELLVDGPRAFHAAVQRGSVQGSTLEPRSARHRVFTLAGGSAGPELQRDSTVAAEAGMVLGVDAALVAGDGRVVEFGGVVVVSEVAADLVTITPTRLVELY